jgi:hypothetical protein
LKAHYFTGSFYQPRAWLESSRCALTSRIRPSRRCSPDVIVVQLPGFIVGHHDPLCARRKPHILPQAVIARLPGARPPNPFRLTPILPGFGRRHYRSLSANPSSRCLKNSSPSLPASSCAKKITACTPQ